VTLETARITLRLHRFELIAFGAALGGLAAVTLLAAAYIAGLTPGPECLAPADATSSFACQRAQEAFSSAQQTLGGLLLTPLLLITYATGLFLGVPIIARELERGTVRLAWWLAPSRFRWYLGRVLPILAVVVALTFAAGVATDRFFAVSNPTVDISQSFDGYGVRGGLLAARALFIFGIAVVVGSVIGRSLPAIIVATLVATIGMVGGLEVQDRILKAEAVAITVNPNDEFGGFRPGDKFIDQKFRLPDGTLVGYEYFGGGSPPTDEFGNVTLPTVNLVIPGDRYRFVEAREALALAVAAIVALLLAAGVVSRRRPG
jgi:hypothetical protein